MRLSRVRALQGRRSDWGDRGLWKWRYWSDYSRRVSASSPRAAAAMAAVMERGLQWERERMLGTKGIAETIRGRT